MRRKGYASGGAVEMKNPTQRPYDENYRMNIKGGSMEVPAMNRVSMRPPSLDRDDFKRKAETPPTPRMRPYEAPVPKPKPRPEGLGTSKPPKIAKTANLAKPDVRQKAKESKEPKQAKLSTRAEFEREFARQRKAGAKTFTFKGKRYSTKLA